MPKRKHDESEDTLETGNVDQGDFSDGDDSDDGDEDGNEKTDKYDMMREDDIEGNLYLWIKKTQVLYLLIFKSKIVSGQEDPTQEFDGEIQITPFNMKEEMEEGDIDKEGMYIFKKREKDEVKDHWLDNIDWVKVNSQAATSSKNMSDEDSSMDATEYLKKFDPIPAYKEMLTILLPGETVLKALKRLGGGKVQTASERWKKKKQEEGTSQDNAVNKEHIAKLTEHANSILSQGNMDVYQETFEGIRYKIQKAEEPVSQKSSNDLDMFGDMFDEKTKAANKRAESESVEGEPTAKKVRFNDGEGQEDEKKFSDTVQWEFKWENDEKADVHGPHSSSEMQEWVNQGYFESGVWVRRVGQQGDFYTSRRIDFDLYL